MMSKKQWQKPELVVLVRNKPEEVVLAACKFTSMAGWMSYNSSCWATKYCTFTCDALGAT